MKKILLPILGLLLLITATGSAFAQSTEGAHPTRLGSNEITGAKHGNTSLRNRRVRRGGRGTTHSIIFVGGKRTGSKKSNPTQAKKVRVELNPQPIPPGKKS